MFPLTTGTGDGSNLLIIIRVSRSNWDSFVMFLFLLLWKIGMLLILSLWQPSFDRKMQGGG